MDSLDRHKPTNVSIFSGEDAIVDRPIRITADQFGRAIIVDAADWSLNLLGIDGNLLFKTGRTGEGPGEYKLINQVEMFNDNKLSVLDKKLYRLTFYSITEDSLTLIKTVNLPDYAPLRVVSIHSTSNNEFVGVFKKIGHPEDGNFIIHKLDTNFKPKNKLLELPGNDQLLLSGSNSRHIDDALGARTHWVVSENKLSFARSDELRIHPIDLKDQSKEQVIFDREIPEYQKNSKTQKYLSERFAPITNKFPDMANKLFERELLPYFLKFAAADRHFYFSIFNSGIAERGKILQINKKTEAVKVIDVPKTFTLFSATNERLYGIIVKNNGANDIAVIKL
ncbi:6-bladed beta-propeller [Fodinibius halophilus]|uniref:6-bladed beta-propeller n=1 Tax=Fodinibius halophilus TaxID=1736908 RepID=A0A6M1T3F1_9BACT|nr:6-bladed beta-propeller [Fodinibius halophilus]NGP87153.1 6-bladed beta-propeller [Fodinibius halophilus]